MKYSYVIILQSGVLLKVSLHFYSMAFNISGVRWQCVSITVTLAHKKSEFDCKSIDVPRDKSYACQVPLYFSTSNKGSFISYVVFEGLQVRF